MRKSVVVLLLGFYVDRGCAVQIESLASAIKRILGPIKTAAKKPLTHGTEKFDVYYDKASKNRFAVVQKRIYQTGNCTHTWVIGIDAQTSSVTEVRMVEYSCPHAKPAAKQSYFDQYRGKGPADVQTLKTDIASIAKATGSCELTTDAVITAIESVDKLKKTL